MRVAVGVGGSAMVAGVAGMAFWIHDGSHYFDLAVAVAMAGLLTLVACVLTKVFGSSHGSQDDAFRRGRSMGYDAGFLEGHRTARPVVVPLHAVGLHAVDMDAVGMDAVGMDAVGMDAVGMDAVERDLEMPVRDVDHVAEPMTLPVTMPVWHRDAWDRVAAGDRMASWMGARRVPLLAGVLSLTLVGVLAATALARPSVPAEAFAQSPGTPSSRAVAPSETTPALAGKARPMHVKAPVAAVAAGGSAVVPAVAGGSAVVPAVAGGSPAVPAVGAEVVVSLVAASYGLTGQPTLPAVAPAPIHQPAVSLPVSTPAGVPAVPAAVVPLTAAQQTAADAAAAAKLTADNAAAAAKRTADNAAAAAAETARVAAAAAEATRAKAAADAYAVAHPGV
jgi:hypothetical protein